MQSLPAREDVGFSSQYAGSSVRLAKVAASYENPDDP